MFNTFDVIYHFRFLYFLSDYWYNLDIQLCDVFPFSKYIECYFISLLLFHKSKFSQIVPSG